MLVERKHLSKIFRFLLLTLFVTFMAIYVSKSAGYIEYENRKQVALTEKQIEKFEADVKAGKNVDLNKYLQNKISNWGLKVSKVMENGVNKVVKVSFKFLADLAE